MSLPKAGLFLEDERDRCPVEKDKGLLPEEKRKANDRGSFWKDKQEVFKRILRIVNTGAHWNHLPDKYPPYQSCHIKIQQWEQAGVISKAVEALARNLHERGGD